MNINFAKPPDWMDNAACAAQAEDVIWFPASPSMVPKAARDKCAGCPVRTKCLDYALRNDVHGIWAGTNAEQRKRMRGAA